MLGSHESERNGVADLNAMIARTIARREKWDRESDALISKVAARRIAPVSAAEILSSSYPEPRFAVPGLVPEGLVILAGRPKIGKSWLALNLALAVDAAGPFLGQMPAVRGACLYLALEDGPRRIKDRLQLVGAITPRELRFEFRLPRLDQGGIDALSEWLEQNPDVRLAIIDVFARVRPQRARNADPYQADADAAALLQQLAIRHGVALVVLHHDRKAGSADWLDTVSGTFGLSGSADAVALLTRERGSARGRLRLTGRDIEERDLALEFDRGIWSVVGAGRELDLSPERRSIVEHLRANPGPFAPREIAAAVSLPEGSARHLLRGLAEEGLIDRPATGRYAHPVHRSQRSQLSFESERGEGSERSEE
jgi:hypothetical protein